MLKRLLLASLLLSATTAAQAEGPIRERLRERMVERLKEKRAEEAKGIDLQSLAPGAQKLAVSYGKDPKQSLDVYTSGQGQNRPILVMVHGGAWKLGDKDSPNVLENKLKHWLPAGYIFISVNYRMLPELMAYEQALDVATAIKHIQANAVAWGGSAEKIVLMGHSAGAHLVALLSAKPDLVGKPWRGTIVLDSAVMRVSDTMSSRHLKFYDEAFGADPAYWTKASPADQWTPAAIPMMIVCSSKRPDKPCRGADAFQAQAKKAGKDTPVLPVDLTHEDVNKTLGLPSAYTEKVDSFMAGLLK